MRNLDFSSWQALLSTLLGLAVFTLIGVGIRLIVMQTIQQRRQRENRQVNERLRTLIAAYKTLGGSFTGSLLVDPTHLRDLRPGAKGGPASGTAPGAASNPGTASSGTTTEPVQTLASPTLPATDLTTTDPITSSERRRRIRDAVEAALSDIILLGTEEQVRMAAHAATEMAQGRPVHTADLVISLRNFIRKVLDLAPIPANVIIPEQGPARPSAAGAKGKDSGKDGGGGGSNAGGGAGGGGGGGGAGMGMGMGLGVGAAHGLHDDDSTTS
ncbi:hypothetical protein [Bordetella sp. N]|uniref:hypothetical protein n=1 Tax=Bordetella sp. N TaxID=1746199 RepID=UPI00070B8E55|nr:hypothetical protein [Bordetella sp. N]ALM84929.1 hypothetical protein ASB57_19885 [Bordetella sp. N]